MLQKVFVLGPLALLLTCCAQPDAGTPTANGRSFTPTPVIGVTLETVAPPTVVVQQTTPTPQPPPSATPTATPVVYTVQEGDTLLAIALQQGVTVDEIVAVNPGLNRDFLTIGQTISLPPRPTAVAQTAAETAVPLAVEVTQIETYRTSTGGVWVLGELTNQGSVAAENVQVQVSWESPTGETVATGTAWAALPVVPAGAKSPFGLLMAPAPSVEAAPVVSIVGGQSVVDLGTRYLEMAVTETAVARRGDRVILSGQVENVGEAVADEVTLAATFYNAAGDVTGFRLERLPGALAAGETAAFTITAVPPGTETVETAAVAQAQLANQQ